MSRLTLPVFIVSSISIFIGASVCETTANAQENVKILTADGVKLHGVFYASEKKNAPTVIMIHPVGEGKSSEGEDWKNLAETLQKAKYSVMMFDFRGHGESTTIEDPMLFWSQKSNVVSVRTKEKEVIDVKDYIKAGGALLARAGQRHRGRPRVISIDAMTTPRIAIHPV